MVDGSFTDVTVTFRTAMDRLRTALHILAGIDAFSARSNLTLPLVNAQEAIVMNELAAEQRSAASLAMPRAPLGERIGLQIALRARDSSLPFNESTPLFGPSSGFITTTSMTVVGAPRPLLMPRNASAIVAARSNRVQIGP